MWNELTSKELSRGGVDVVEDDVALVHGLAVATAAVQLAEGLDGESANGEGTGAVVLENLVLGSEGATRGDGGGLAGVLVLDGESVLANSRPPDVVESAATVAVDTLDLVGSDDDVGELGALLEDEDGVRVTTFGLASAGDTAVESLHATIEGGTSGDGLGSLED